MTQRAYMLVINSDEELGSLAEWLREHPDEEDMKADGLDPALKPRLDAFLRSAEESHDALPFYTPVPLDLAPLLEWVMDDWGEVLASHDEALETELLSVEA
jgi:hypothetical protein